MFLFILLTYHEQNTFCKGSFGEICPQKTFLKDLTDYFLQWQCCENLSTKNIFEGTVTMTLRTTFTVLHSITLTVIMIVLTESFMPLVAFLAKLEKLKTDNIYWNKLWWSIENLNGLLSELRESYFK